MVTVCRPDAGSVSRRSGRGVSADRSTARPEASVTVAASSAAASALLRRTSAMTAGRLPFCMRVCANCCGLMSYCRACRMRYSLSSASSTTMARSSAMASRMNCALTDFSALSRSSRSQSSRV